MGKQAVYQSPDYSRVCTISYAKNRGGGRKKRTKKSKVKKVLLIFFVVVLILLLSAYLVLRAVSPKIVEISRAQINTIMKVAVNSAVLEVMSNSIKYSDLVTVEKDSSGTVSLIEAKAMTVNQLARDTAVKVQDKLIAIGAQEIRIPLGQLTGIPFLANRGQIITILIEPYASVTCNFISEFESAGINQTRHMLSIAVLSSVAVILPSYTGTIDTETEVLVTESIIVGKVPEMFLNMKVLGGSQLDLTP